MKQKDIIVLIVATIVIVASFYFGYKMLNPDSAKKTETTEADKIKSIPTTLDDKTFERINKLSDYGEPSLDNIGKSDLFAGY